MTQIADNAFDRVTTASEVLMALQISINQKAFYFLSFNRSFLSDDQEVRVQLADSGATAAARRRHLRPMDRGKGQHGARARLHVQSRRVWLLYLLEERGKGEVTPDVNITREFHSIIVSVAQLGRRRHRAVSSERHPSGRSAERHEAGQSAAQSTRRTTRGQVADNLLGHRLHKH